MTQECFRVEMARLRDEFGAKHYTPNREDSIGRALISLPDTSVRRIVQHFVDSARYAPLPRDFQQAARAEQAQLGYAKIDKPQAPIECHWCNDGGVVEVERIKSGKEYFMRCTCEAGAKSMRSDFPFWSESFAPYFKLHKMFGQRALKWKPRKGFDTSDPIASLTEMAELWNDKVKISRVLWGEMEALKAARTVEDTP